MKKISNELENFLENTIPEIKNTTSLSSLFDNDDDDDNNTDNEKE